jgi:Ser-tRNA(Ala) deacylase AlaX
MAGFTATEKLYLSQVEAFESEAIVLSCSGDEIILDRTIFHAQGGGQPADVGEIVGEGKIFVVATVSCDADGVIRHGGNWKEGSAAPEREAGAASPFEVGETVRLKIDREKRLLATRLHSMGHLIDKALESLGYAEKLKPGKGYHFPESPYVEYAVEKEIVPAELEALPALLKLKTSEFIAAAIPTVVEVMSRDDAAKVCSMDISKYPETLRMVTIADYPIPCGGTHVANTKDLGEGWTFGKIKKKKGNIRVTYNNVSSPLS